MLRLAGPLASPGPTRTRGNTQNRLATTTSRQLLKTSKKETPRPLWAMCTNAQYSNRARSVSWCSDRTLCVSVCACCLSSKHWVQVKSWLCPLCSSLQFDFIYSMADRSSPRNLPLTFSFFFFFFSLFYFKHRPTVWWKVNCYIIKNLDGLKKKKKNTNLTNSGCKLTEVGYKCLPQADYSLNFTGAFPRCFLGKYFSSRHGQRKNTFFTSNQKTQTTFKIKFWLSNTTL